MSVKISVNKKSSNLYTYSDLECFTKNELIEKVLSLQAHNLQLKNLLNKNNIANKQETNNKVKKPFDFSSCTYRHIFIKLFYLGWDYNGFVVQEDTNKTIEHYLFEALSKTCLIKDRQESNYHRCGRTDKGVSSFDQTISITVRSKLPVEQQENIENELDYCCILNSVLPDNIQCLCWAPVSSKMSARFDCTGRTYKYYFPKFNLNIQKMQEASKHFLGSHDFRNICKMDVGNGVSEFTRTINCIEIFPFKSNEDTPHEYSIYVAKVESKGFLWHQIRCIMALLFLVGEEKEEADIIKELLDVQSNPRKPDYSMASEIPLNLFECQFSDIQWHFSKSSEIALQKLRKLWTFNAIKTSMIFDMIRNLEELQPNALLTNYLSTETKTKNYIPLMKRKKCESLESKIQHYAKRNRIEVLKN